MIALITILILSLAVNALLVWYIRKMLTKLLYVSDSIGSLMVSAKNFSDHLDGLHAMEMYYGDQTLGALIDHSKQVIEDIREFEEIYTLTNEDLEESEEQE